MKRFYLFLFAVLFVFTANAQRVTDVLTLDCCSPELSTSSVVAATYTGESGTAYQFHLKASDAGNFRFQALSASYQIWTTSTVDRVNKVTVVGGSDSQSGTLYLYGSNSSYATSSTYPSQPSSLGDDLLATFDAVEPGSVQTVIVKGDYNYIRFYVGGTPELTVSSFTIEWGPRFSDLVLENWEYPNLADMDYYVYTPEKDGLLSINSTALDELAIYTDEDLAEEPVYDEKGGSGEHTYTYEMKAGTTYYFTMNFTDAATGCYMATYAPVWDGNEAAFYFSPVNGCKVDKLETFTVGYYYGSLAPNEGGFDYEDLVVTNESGETVTTVKSLETKDDCVVVTLNDAIETEGTYSLIFPTRTFVDNSRAGGNDGPYIFTEEVHVSYLVGKTAENDVAYADLLEELNALRYKLTVTIAAAEELYYSSYIEAVYDEITTSLDELQAALEKEYTDGSTIDEDAYSAQIAALDAAVDEEAPVSQYWYDYFIEKLNMFEDLYWINLDEVWTAVYTDLEYGDEIQWYIMYDWLAVINDYVEAENYLYECFIEGTLEDAGDVIDAYEQLILKGIDDLWDIALEVQQEFVLYYSLYDQTEEDSANLESTWQLIISDYPDAVASLMEDYENIGSDIDEVQTLLYYTFSFGVLADYLDEIEADIAAIEAAIEKLLADAKALYDPSGISAVSADGLEGAEIYTLSGVKVDAPAKAGVYIVDGKKVLIK